MRVRHSRDAGAFRYRSVATGGTFDHLHAGHRSLLKKSFEVGEEVTIGLTSDEYAGREGKSPSSFAEREAALREYISSNFPGRKYAIVELHDTFGPGIANARVQALVASPETASKLQLANRLRAEKGYPPLELVTVEWVKADDGAPISSTRIRRGEIDAEGRLGRRG